MTRPLDRPIPLIAVEDHPRLAAWPVRPVVAIGGTQAALEWDDPANLWDITDSGGVGATSSRVAIAVVGTAQVGAP